MSKRIKVKVCDSIMGSGKTMAAINMMNNNKDKKYIYITPLLSEVERIKNECYSRKFVSPEKKYANGFSKLNAIHDMIRAGKNIASTHALFGYYTQETIDLLKAGHYTLVMDEVVDVVCEAELDKYDLSLLIESKHVSDDGEHITWDDSEYKGKRFEDIYFKSRSKNLILFENKSIFWIFPTEVFTAFDDVYSLTYMFSSQIQCYFLQVNNIDYEYIGVKNINSMYQFCPLQDMNVSELKRSVASKIHVLNNNKMNEIGNKRGSLSASWYKAGREKPEFADRHPKIKKNLLNLFTNIYHASVNQIMWTVYEKSESRCRGKGYTNGFVACTSRATNQYSDRIYLAYCVNMFFHPWKKNYFQQKGAVIEQDGYALSEMLQWIFRSAIRNGKDIWIYVPSRRMRELLLNWMDTDK